jgi:hypothetical protein
MTYITNNANKSIFITRGDTGAPTPVTFRTIVDGVSAEYTIQPTDKMILTVREFAKKSPADTVYVLRKEYIGSNLFDFAPEDTAELACKGYVYDIELQIGDDIHTVIPLARFTVGKEVSWGCFQFLRRAQLLLSAQK